MADLDRKELQAWDIDDASDLATAINEAESVIDEKDPLGSLGWVVYPSKGPANVTKVTLVSVELGPNNFAYEIELS